MGKLIQCCLVLLAPALLQAQSSSNFSAADATAVVTQAPPQEGESPSTTTPAPSITTPSRNLNPEEIPAYVNEMVRAFSITSRETDPFGQYQDPNARPVIRKPVVRQDAPPPVPAVPLSEIIERIEITTIMPSSNAILVGSRSFKKGEQIPVVFQGKRIQLEIMGVSARQIDFRNAETGETASRVMNLLPPGMTKGHQGLSAPGMFSEGDAPLQLDQGN